MDISTWKHCVMNLGRGLAGRIVLSMTTVMICGAIGLPARADVYDVPITDMTMEWSPSGICYRYNLKFNLGVGFSEIDSVGIRISGQLDCGDCRFDLTAFLSDSYYAPNCSLTATSESVAGDFTLAVPFLPATFDGGFCPEWVLRCDVPPNYTFMTDGLFQLSAYFNQPYRWCEESPICYAPPLHIDDAHLEIWYSGSVPATGSTWGEIKAMYR